MRHGARLTRGTRAAFAVLGAIGVLAALVPLLPLRAPAEVRLAERLRPPRLDFAWERGFAAEQIRSPGGLTRALVAARTSVFGDRMLPAWLGTDELGRCLLSRLLWGSRLTLLVGMAATAVSLVIGVLWGAAAGWCGGRVDGLLMRAVDVLYALPLMFLVIFVVALLRGLRTAWPDFAIDPTIALFAVIGAVSWLTIARLVRAETLALRGAGFVQAAVLAGVAPARIVTRHVVPNVMPQVLVMLTLTVPRVMLLEAFLSFLGLGVEAPDVSWGLLARQGFDALTAVHASWWLVAFPGLALAGTLFALNLAGDGLRDALDPRAQRAAS